ncbi:MAG: mechanosensitive ion channel domain-containing protein [Thiolinea sp.]
MIRLLYFFIFMSFALISTTGNANELTELLTGETKEEISDKVISKDNSPQDDKKIRSRIREIFGELDKLKEVKVQVRKGVVTLSGEIDTADISKRATQYARQVEGVVEVANQLTITRNIERRVNSTLERLQKTGTHLLNSLPLFLLALLVLVCFWWFARWVSRRRSVYEKLTPNAFIATLLSQIVRIIIFLFGIILALALLDATSLIGTVLGAAGIVGLAIGFAIRDTVENYIASILLSLRNPFEPDDWVKIEGYEGRVIRLTSRATVLLTADGNHVRIPNSTVFKGIITNYTRNPKRRLGFVMALDAHQDIPAKQAQITTVLIDIEGVLDEPPPKTVIQDMDDSVVTLEVYGWVDQERYSFSRVRSEAIRLVRQALDKRTNTRHALEVQDLSVEHELDDQLEQDREAADSENLLRATAPKEL